MSIPSLIASPEGAARYVVNTLHPHNVWEIVQRDGIAVALAELVDVDHGWSYIDATQCANLHPLHAGNDRFAAVAGYGVSHNELPPIANWGDTQQSATALRAVFVLGHSELRIHATGLDLAVPYADLSPNWCQFDHVVDGGPPPRLQLVTAVDHPSCERH